ncbi:MULTISPECIES: hypothetical protein [unclassified Mesorhizobium]|uniref:hypothetical protein n=1 Tax=unclassified Mesorhizobium TaxID=325217 RepID=UPI0011292998|nr:MULTISPECIES: hypothetical protein [unclassified Mesorhizobium]MBZ9893566.1 hypothetical protein [Mesorhizobium sp. BR1-1-6]MBZ9960675.1 hypothetical protein [Mesorhizobium sp. BR1-1-14]MCA0059155.1 hypothetical protein [Mesorhizobium sp. B261B1A]TPK61320.1 hypothetical protein FJ551_19615 [Mesorhizobium sp. B2-5-1]TPL11259.1 hypothetical protein FJ944_11390 [Mesorhizobium sp. B2-4-11]
MSDASFDLDDCFARIGHAGLRDARLGASPTFGVDRSGLAFPVHHRGSPAEQKRMAAASGFADALGGGLASSFPTARPSRQGA